MFTYVVYSVMLLFCFPSLLLQNMLKLPMAAVILYCRPLQSLDSALPVPRASLGRLWKLHLKLFEVICDLDAMGKKLHGRQGMHHSFLRWATYNFPTNLQPPPPPDPENHMIRPLSSAWSRTDLSVASNKVFLHNHDYRLL